MRLGFERGKPPGGPSELQQRQQTQCAAFTDPAPIDHSLGFLHSPIQPGNQSNWINWGLRCKQLCKQLGLFPCIENVNCLSEKGIPEARRLLSTFPRAGRPRFPPFDYYLFFFLFCWAFSGSFTPLRPFDPPKFIPLPTVGPPNGAINPYVHRHPYAYLAN